MKFNTTQFYPSSTFGKKPSLMLLLVAGMPFLVLFVSFLALILSSLILSTCSLMTSLLTYTLLTLILDNFAYFLTLWPSPFLSLYLSLLPSFGAPNGISGSSFGVLCSLAHYKFLVLFSPTCSIILIWIPRAGDRSVTATGH